jgi:cell shape-determining protein MreC
MNFLLKSKPKRNYDPKIVLSIGLFVILAFLVFIFPNFFRTAAHTSMKPLWLLRDKTTNYLYFFTDFISFKSTLIEENTKLKEELTTLRLNKIDYDFLLKENEDLKEQVGKKSHSNTIISNILSKPPQSPFDTFVIDVGVNSGVNVGNKVYISDSIIIGAVSEVTGNSSIVKLFSSGGEKQEVILYRTGASYLVSGNGGANFQLEVPKESDIVWGDSVVYPGAKDSILAMVYYVDSNSQSSFKTVYLRIPGNVFQTKQVFVEI